MTDDRELMSFTSRDEWRAWLQAHHDRATEAWLVLYKKGARETAFSFIEAIVQEVAER